MENLNEIPQPREGYVWRRSVLDPDSFYEIPVSLAEAQRKAIAEFALDEVRSMSIEED